MEFCLLKAFTVINHFRTDPFWGICNWQLAPNKPVIKRPGTDVKAVKKELLCVWGWVMWSPQNQALSLTVSEPDLCSSKCEQSWQTRSE